MAPGEDIRAWLQAREGTPAAGLAELASLAARVEPALLRRLRLRLLPAAHAEAEAEVWFSPLVASQSAGALLFHAEAREVLRQRLTADRLRLRSAWKITRELHVAAPPALQLEEEITYWALAGASRAALERKLRTALAALVEGKQTGLAIWAARALPQLPAAVRQTEAAWLLAAAASAALGGSPVLEEEEPAGISPEKLAAVQGEAETTFIGVRLLEDGLEFGPPDLAGAKLMRVPKASPVVIEVADATFESNAPAPPQRMVFPLGQRRKLASPPPPGADAPPAPAAWRISTVLGEQHFLRRLEAVSGWTPTEERLHARLNAPGPKRILSIEGGGARTTASLHFLARIEALLARRSGHSDFRLADYFDLIGGSSAGAVIAACLARGMKVAEVQSAWDGMIASVFGRRSLLWPMAGPRYRDGGLNKALADQFGNQTLDDAAFRTGLCIFLRRLDTGGTWALANHPASRYHPQQRGVLLRAVLRAALAAPTIFGPVELTLGDGQRGVYMDAAAGLAANPAWPLFRLATSRRFPFQWASGHDRLLFVEIGAGAWTRSKPAREMARMGLIEWAGGLPALLLANARRQSAEWIEAFAHVLTEPGTPRPKLPVGRRLSLVRYDFPLEEAGLRELGLHDLAPRAEALRSEEDMNELPALHRVGEAAAARRVHLTHFPGVFDLRPDSAAESSA